MTSSNMSRRAMFALFAGAGALAVSGAKADAPNGEDRMIEGSVMYRERMMLPQGARAEVQLVDVSLADAPSVVIARTEIANAASSPIPFRLSYDPALIQSRHRYALQARISLGDDLLFINDTHHAFEPGQASADILVKRVAAQAQQAPLTLFGSWLAEDIGGGGVIDYAQTTLEIAEDGMVTGSGGCNRYSGRATVDGEKLVFSPLASTEMACAVALMNQEQKFHQALASVAFFRLVPDEKKLLLLNAAGDTTVRLASME